MINSKKNIHRTRKNAIRERDEEGEEEEKKKKERNTTTLILPSYVNIDSGRHRHSQIISFLLVTLRLFIMNELAADDKQSTTSLTKYAMKVRHGRKTDA